MRAVTKRNVRLAADRRSANALATRTPAVRSLHETRPRSLRALAWRSPPAHRPLDHYGESDRRRVTDTNLTQGQRRKRARARARRTTLKREQGGPGKEADSAGRGCRQRSVSRRPAPGPQPPEEAEAFHSTDGLNLIAYRTRSFDERAVWTAMIQGTRVPVLAVSAGLASEVMSGHAAAERSSRSRGRQDGWPS